MNTTRLVIAVIVGFVFIFATDFLIHALWLGSDYAATKELWRSDAEMQSRFHWMIIGHFLAALAFVLIWALGFAGRGTLGLACTYGFLVGLLTQAHTIISYVVSPLPSSIALKWIGSGVLQTILFAVVVFLFYKPAHPTARG